MSDRGYSPSKDELHRIRPSHRPIRHTTVSTFSPHTTKTPDVLACRPRNYLSLQVAPVRHSAASKLYRPMTSIPNARLTPLATFEWAASVTYRIALPLQIAAARRCWS